MLQREDLVFPMVEYERRLSELRARMTTQELDALITTTPENICYLTGFESPGHYYFNALVIPLDGEPFTVPRQLEDSGVQELTWVELSHPYQDYEHPIDKLAQTLERYHLADKRIGFEKDCWFFTASQQERLFQALQKATFVDSSGIVEEGRLIKSEYEIEIMRKAAKATEAGMRAGVDTVQAGVTENDIAAEIHYAMIKAGSEWPSIAPFVASGYRGAIGHATWAGRTVQVDEFILIEIGGCYKRYHTALMRTCFTGTPTPKVHEAIQVVQEAFQAMLDTIKPGISAAEADAAGRKVIAESEFGGVQSSRSAYSIGIGLPPDWGEGYILSMQPKETRHLEANMTFHVLPWVQVPGEGAISCSETIRITDDGCEILTDFPRELFLR